ncbi:MAG: hypothetical protein KDB27_33650 [Planctomycetales bacterium]|nr:hypothetical protein [Planctomycetales bacterium]
MSSQQDLEMHQQHRNAESNIRSWIDDIYMWRAEHKQALAWLAQIESVIHQNDATLQDHSSMIDRLERHIRQHEHEIAVEEKKEEFNDHTLLDDQHAEFTDNLTQANDAHTHIGKRHRQQMADLKRMMEQFVSEKKS